VPDWWPHQRLVVLADTAPTKDGGHRAVPLRLIAGPAGHRTAPDLQIVARGCSLPFRLVRSQAGIRARPARIQ
jgi:hypothetical protein